ncbi:MAG: T9SS type A sorting domain-containing protein [Rhodothermales bacterium]|nr:T9SS type A sorting domain-containing protein [Rhodothermales bacterium]
MNHISFTRATGTSVEADGPDAGFELYQSFPNPATSSTTVAYSLPNSAEISLALYDRTGKLVRRIDSGSRPPGRYELEIDTSGLSGGVYFYRLSANGRSVTKSVTVL